MKIPQGVFVLSYLKNKIKYLKEIVDNRLQMRYIRNYMTLHPGGNCVEPVRGPCPARRCA